MKKIRITHGGLRVTTVIFHAYLFLFSDLKATYLAGDELNESIVQYYVIFDRINKIFLIVWIVFCLVFIVIHRKKQKEKMKN